MIRPISQVSVKGKRLVVRADLNVPMDGDQVTDLTRITRFATGMRPLLASGARLVILTHFGRPKATQPDPAFSVQKLLAPLSNALGCDVAFAPQVRGLQTEAISRALPDGSALLVENLRFDAGETANDPVFAADLAALGDLYVNDAFSVSHRAHASTEALAHLLPAYGGPLLIEELSALSSALETPQRPAVAIVGGAKVSSKINVLRNLVGKVDHLIVGGGMANTFLFADGAPMGKSLHEADQLSTVADIRRLAAQNGCTILVQKDAVISRDFKAGAASETVDAHACPADAMILDAGPEAVKSFSRVLGAARTILWNGPLGAFEIPPFDRATVALAKRAAALTQDGNAITVAGGGDTVAALNAAGVAQDFTYVSSAGGAFLEWLEGQTLPGIAALMRVTEKV